MLGVGLAAASLTAYRDFVLGVKSTLFADPGVVIAVLVRLGVPPAGSSPVVMPTCLLGLAREGRRIDFRPAKVGSLEEKPVFGVLAESKFVDGARVKLLLGGESIVLAIGSEGRGRIDLMLSDRGSLEKGAVKGGAGVSVVSDRTASKAFFNDLTLFDRSS